MTLGFGFSDKRCHLQKRGGGLDGRTVSLRRIVGDDRVTTAAVETATVPVSRPQAAGSARCAQRHLVCAAKWYPLGDAAPRDGMRLRHDVLAVLAEVATTGRLAESPRGSAGQVARCRRDRLVSGRSRQRVGAGSFGGAKTGPNPTDRRKAGSKHHLITDAQGVPLAAILSSANAHDVTQLVPLVDAIPPIAGKVGRPRRRPDAVQGDRGYDSEPHREELRARRIQPILARRNTPHGSGLGVHRWVVERTLSWLHQFRRLRVRFERRPDIHEAFLSLGCVLICWHYFKRLVSSFC